jgi:hypothetical protein
VIKKSEYHSRLQKYRLTDQGRCWLEGEMKDK